MMMYRGDAVRQKFNKGDRVRYKTVTEMYLTPAYWLHKIVEGRNCMDKKDIMRTAGKTGVVCFTAPNGCVDICLDENGNYLFSYPWELKLRS